MSIKSLLQLILLTLIVLIIGGIYFLYFYSNSNDEILNYKKNLEEMNVNEVNENLMENSINLEDKKVELEQVKKANKNIQQIGDETLLSKKIKTCIKANIGEVIVSTNSSKIRKYSEKTGKIEISVVPELKNNSEAIIIKIIKKLTAFVLFTIKSKVSL